MIKARLKELKKSFIVIFLVSLLLVTPQILNHSLILGADSIFHMNRIYDTYMQFKTGNFNYFQTNYGFIQSGRVVNAVYGPGFAYILGVILLSVHSWFKFQVITSFLGFFISGYSMYYLSRTMKVKRNIALMTAVLFMGSFWGTSWEINQNFMTWGIMLMPLVVVMGLRMIDADTEKFKVIPLALIVSFMIQVHMLSAAMSVVVLGIFFIIAIIKNDNKINLLLKCISASVSALLLTFNLWGSMLELFTSNTLYSPFAEEDMAGWTMNISTGNYDYIHLGIVMSILFIAQILVVFSRIKEASLANKIVTFTGAGFLLLSSNVFPWKLVSEHFPQLQTFLQFPYRFNGFAMVLLLAGLGVTLSGITTISMKKNLEIGLMVGCTFVLYQAYDSLQYTNEYWNSNQPIVKKSGLTYSGHYSNKQIVRGLTSSDLGLGISMVRKSNPDYLPEYHGGTNDSYGTYDKKINKYEEKTSKSVDKGTLKIKWTAKSKNETVELPVVVYKNSKVLLNGKKLTKKDLKLSTIGTPTVISRKKGQNTLSLSYRSKIVTNKRLIVVAFAWMVSLLIVLITYFKTIKIKLRNRPSK